MFFDCVVEDCVLMETCDLLEIFGFEVCLLDVCGFEVREFDF